MEFDHDHERLTSFCFVGLQTSASVPLMREWEDTDNVSGKHPDKYAQQAYMLCPIRHRSVTSNVQNFCKLFNIHKCEK